MREIIFRGKRLDNGEWAEGFYISHLNACHYIIPFRTGGYEAMDNSFYVHKWFEVDPSTIGQYTGLKDKQGKRIFEGDIIKRFWLGAEIIYCVRYDGENARFIGKALNKSGFTTFDGDGEMFEVIGNVTDNPEFLKEEAQT